MSSSVHECVSRHFPDSQRPMSSAKTRADQNRNQQGGTLPSAAGALLRWALILRRARCSFTEPFPLVFCFILPVGSICHLHIVPHFFHLSFSFISHPPPLAGTGLTSISVLTLSVSLFICLLAYCSCCSSCTSTCQRQIKCKNVPCLLWGLIWC